LTEDDQEYEAKKDKERAVDLYGDVVSRTSRDEGLAFFLCSFGQCQSMACGGKSDVKDKK
jgi:hypothetical protein